MLEQLALGHELPAKIIEHRTLAKLKSTYADSLPTLINARTGRIHPSFNQLVAVTGRLSSSNPNAQNIPIRTELGRRIRAAFVPEAGHRFLAADYSQIELRILAHVSGEESLIEAFRRGEDIHRRTAAEVFGVPLDHVTSQQRDVAKTTNFAVIYGVTAFGLSRGLDMTQKQAQEYLNQFFARHPKVKAYLDAHGGGGSRARLRLDAARPPALSARAAERQPQPARLRRAHGDQCAHPGHRRRSRQDRDGPRRRAS